MSTDLRKVGVLAVGIALGLMLFVGGCGLLLSAAEKHDRAVSAAKARDEQRQAEAAQAEQDAQEAEASAQEAKASAQQRRRDAAASAVMQRQSQAEAAHVAAEDARVAAEDAKVNAKDAATFDAETRHGEACSNGTATDC